MSENIESIEIDISDEEFLTLAKMAHEKDITLNKLFQLIIDEEIKRIDNSLLI